MSKLATTPNYSSEQYKYSTQKGFFEYAFPESDSSTGTIIAAYQDFYDAGYTNGLINQLMRNLRQKLGETKTLPANTKIFALDICPDISKLSDFLNEKITGQDLSSTQKLVFILPLSIESHAHSLVIHFENTPEGPIVHTIFKDPYGESFAFESKTYTVINQVTIFAQKICASKIKTFKYKSDAIDLQGFNYDYSNCAPITIYCLEKFLEQALTDSRPNEYKISLSFDMFSDPEMNIAAHNAFVLRQKLEQLQSVREDYELAFQSARATNFKDATKSSAAKESIGNLLEEIFDSATAKYIEQKFITPDKYEKISNLDKAQQIKLLNSISLYIVKTASSNIINPSELSEAIGRIIDNFDSELEPMTQEHRQLMQDYSIFTEDMLNFMLLGMQPRHIGSVESKLIKSIQKNDWEIYQSYVTSRTAEQIEEEINAHDRFGKTAITYAIELENTFIIRDLCEKGADILTPANKIGTSALKSAAINAQNIEILETLLSILAGRNDYFDILTDLLQFLAIEWSENGNFITRDLEQNTDIRCQILNKLLSEGADPFVKPILSFYENGCLSSPSAIQNIARSKPALAQTFLNNYPEKLITLFLEAIEGRNSDLINYLQLQIQESTFTNDAIQLQKLFFAALKGKNLSLVKYCIDQESFDEKELKDAMEYMSTSHSEILRDERRLKIPGSNDPKALKKIRAEKAELKKIQELLQKSLRALEEDDKTPTKTSGKRIREEYQPDDTDKTFTPDRSTKKQNISEHAQVWGKLITSTYTPIIKAAKIDDDRLVKLIFEMSSVQLNINMFDEHEYNALLYATYYKSYKVMKFLLDNGADINVCTTREGKQAVFKLAISNDDIDVLPSLIEFANNHSNGIDISDLLHYAINCRASNAVELLINIDSITPNIIQKAINDAIQISDIDILKILLTKVDGDALHTKYETQNWLPLERAVIMSNIEAVELLLEAGSDVNTWIDERPVKLACSSRCDIEILQKLLENGAIINNIPLKSWEYNPLGYSIFQNNIAATKLLLELGANPNENTPNGTALDIASNYYSYYSRESFSREDLFSLLVEHGANTYNSSLNNSYLIVQYFEKIHYPLNDLTITFPANSCHTHIPNDVYATTELAGDEDSYIEVC